MLSSPRGDIFVLYRCHCLQQKWPNQSTLFARIFTGPGLVGQEKGFCSVQIQSVSQNDSHFCKFSIP